MFAAGHAGLAILLLVAALGARAQVVVSGKVLDENGVAVAGVEVLVEGPEGFTPARALSDKAGQFKISLERAGEYRVHAAREGFFQLKNAAVTFQEGDNETVLTLNHLQEFAESVDVTYSPPAIELDQPAERKQLNTLEVLTVPYPAPQDLRNALPLFNGVIQDAAGRAHVNGAAAEQTNYSLDGFNISDPVTGRFESRINIETVQALELETSRFSPDKGRASAGSLDIKTKMGDDRWRFGGTNFIPGISIEGGLHVNKWTPRLEVSGPLARGRAWFHNGFDAFYNVDIVSGLPQGQDRVTGLTASNLSRFQVNLTPANILTTSFLVNYANSRRNGLSFLNPAETTTNRNQDLYMSTIRDQITFHNGALVDVGFADTRGMVRQLPQGNQVYQITPFGSRGNYYVNQDRHFYRQQWSSNVFLPTRQFFGSHQVKFGVDFEREAFHQLSTRHDYEVLRVDGSRSRYVTFAGSGFEQKRNFEGAQYVVDHWSPRDTLSVEAGLRTDWDEVVREVLWAPRISAAWAPKALPDTKFAGGYGLFFDALTLGMLARNQDQVSLSTFYGPDGAFLRGPVETGFLVNQSLLRAPRFRTLSASVDRKLPLDLYGRIGWTDRRGENGFTFIGQPGTGVSPIGGFYQLANSRRDRYQAVEFSVRRTFSQFEWRAGYTRSSSRTNAVVDYSLENPIFGPQAPGPLPWDAPNRFLAWGWAPLPQRLFPSWLQFAVRDTDIACLVEYRTGFPFTVVNDEGLMVGAPNRLRLPGYFNINLHFERKFRALHYLWAWRFGFNNITNNGNPDTVNSNIDSPYYLTYGRGQLRAFSVRLRLLGKK